MIHSYAATSECVPVSSLIRVLFPTEGKPMKPTDATPVRATSNPIPVPPPDFEPSFVSSSLRNLPLGVTLENGATLQFWL